jgi:hypothetical protein
LGCDFPRRFGTVEALDGGWARNLFAICDRSRC